jgi:hypothetical protein
VRKSQFKRVEYETALEKKFSVPAKARIDRNFNGLYKHRAAECKAGKREWVKGRGYTNKVRFGTLPEWMRPVAEQELQRLIAQTKARGQQITRHKLASLIGNATAIARDCRCTKNMLNRMFLYQMDKAKFLKMQEHKASVMAERLSACKDAGMERGDAEA